MAYRYASTGRQPEKEAVSAWLDDAALVIFLLCFAAS